VNDYIMDAPASEDMESIHGRTFSPPNGQSPLFSEELFTTLLTRERKRAERSRQPFTLLLLDASQAFRAHPRDLALGGLLVALAASTRETDIWGWYKEGAVIGVILTELGSADPQAVRDRVLAKVRAVLHAHLGPVPCAQIRLAFYVFPGASEPQNGHANADDLPEDAAGEGRETGGETQHAVGRWFRGPRGRAGAVPAVAIAIRLPSKGPVL
jgi:hypothetical protein